MNGTVRCARTRANITSSPPQHIPLSRSRDLFSRSTGCRSTLPHSPPSASPRGGDAKNVEMRPLSAIISDKTDSLSRAIRPPTLFLNTLILSTPFLSRLSNPTNRNLVPLTSPFPSEQLCDDELPTLVLDTLIGA